MNDLQTKTADIIEAKPGHSVSPLFSGHFDKMVQLAEMMASSRTLPTHFQGSPGDCLRLIEIAHRIGQSPYSLADGVYFVNGRMSYEGKIIAAMINASPRIKGSLSYEYKGEGEECNATVEKKGRRSTIRYRNRSVVVSGFLSGESQPRTVEVTAEMGATDASGAADRWISDTDQMLAYYGARVWARRFAPEIIQGMYTREEMAEVEPKPAIVREIVRPVISAKSYKNHYLKLINEASSILELTEAVKAMQGRDASRQVITAEEMEEIRAAYRDRLQYLREQEAAEEELSKQQEAAQASQDEQFQIQEGDEQC